MDNRFFRVYRYESGDRHFLVKISAFLADRPGSLAELAGIFKQYSINIIFFSYDRSVHPNRVLLEVKCSSDTTISQVYEELSAHNLLDPGLKTDRSALGVIDTRSILKIEVRLEHTPGTLGDFAALLARHEANVIYMEYNEEISETSAKISLFTQDPEEVDRLLKDINAHGYYYSIIYKGAGHKEIEDVIGLNLTERFFFKLKSLLKTEDISRLKKLIDSSQKMTDTLLKFSNEAGKHYEEGNIITNVLTFASASLMNTGAGFTYRKLRPLTFDNVTFHAFRMPTGGNIYILQCDKDAVMIDSSYGLYFEDVKAMLRGNAIDPSIIGRIYLTHADADHSGLSGYFAGEFGSRVYLHKDARGIIDNENRAWGSGSPISDLNHYFTILVNEFTKLSIPSNWMEYADGSTPHESGFMLIDEFTFCGHTYKVLESLGGHTPGQVFIFSHDSGLIFTGDYLLNVESLGQEERDILNYPKFMMTSTNVNSLLFRREMDMLREFIGRFDAELVKSGKEAVIVPGHGDYYSFRGVFNKSRN
ncbi:MAG: MBL fold metallo-hydrolase [Nitrospirota bacterium]